ncbi:mediterrocin family bacteriocin [Peribacillus frigoritolerans]|uniref:mediterrocin family bacteriocin n=1 Tax=Peribacillus frigoritolerans TaxID=450367 RepID=UPI002232236E|nr:hypothetical protein [Peribacillus frigoritolerans]UZD44896.1 hypothetical protein OMJ04_14650 [Peribacillus frigoritolerans]
MKKALVSASLALGLLGASTSAFATDITHTNGSKGFSSPWTSYDNGTNWTMDYGFNTSAINEDFTHTKHGTTSHIAKVRNFNGTHSDADTKGNWAGIEVKHSGSTITYIMTW